MSVGYSECGSRSVGELVGYLKGGSGSVGGSSTGSAG